MTNTQREAHGTGFRRSLRSRWLGPVLLLASFGCSGEQAAHAERPERVQQWSCADAPMSEAPMRRLTRFEYSNTVSDVFGVTLPFDNLLPRDEMFSANGTSTINGSRVVARPTSSYRPFWRRSSPIALTWSSWRG